MTVTLGDVTLGALKQAELLLNWKNRFALQRACVKLRLSFISHESLLSCFVCLLLRVENSQADSLRELENMDVSLVATFISVNLYSMSK